MRLRRIFIAFFIVTFILAILISVPSTASPVTTESVIAEPSDLVNKSIEREVTITQYGLIVIKDNFTVQSKSKTINGSEIAFLKEDLTKIYHVSAYDANRTTLAMGNRTTQGSFVFQPLIYTKAIEPLETYSFVVVTALAGSVKPYHVGSTATTQNLTATFRLYPLSPYFTEETTVNVKFFEGVTVPGTLNFNPTPVEITGGKLIYSKENIKELNVGETFSVRYQTNNPILRFITAERELEIDPWGYIYVRETQTLKNVGLNQTNVKVVKISLPPGAEQIHAHDSVGNLSISVVEPENLNRPVNITLNLRYRVSGGGEEYPFWLYYRIGLENYTKIENGKYIFSTWSYSASDIPMDSFQFTVILPQGSSLRTTRPHNINSTYQTNGKTAYVLQNSGQNAAIAFGYVYMEYTFPGIFMYSRGLLLSFVVAIISLLYVASSRYVRPLLIPSARPEVISAPAIPVVKTFCSLYDEKTALQLELRQIAQDLRKKKIKKFEYAKRKKLYEDKLTELNKKLLDSKRKMINLSGRYAETINKIEVKETEQDAIRENTRRLIERYRSKKITRTTYERLRKEYARDLQRAANEIDRIILELREEIR
ncbi:MAG: hypothetical protein ACFFCD_03410 [Promethearchaeota archaeon]